MKILILGGTAEARALAKSLVALGHDVTTSLAGRTQDPILPMGAVRVGPFGGVEGLCSYLRDEAIEALIDATHPYAAQMSANAVAAAQKTGLALIRLMRPPWQPEPGDSWTLVDNAEAAAAALPAGARVLLTTGHADLQRYLLREDCLFVVRVIETPDEPLPGHARLLLARPPYDIESEREVMAQHRITHLVSKNSGGGQTAAKFAAAREMGIEVIMIARPAYAPAREVDSVEAAIAALGINAS